MKLQAQVGDKTHEVEIRRDGRQVFARVDDREYELEASEPEANVYLLKHEGRVHEFFVSPRANVDAPYMVSSKSGDTEVTVIDPKKLRGSNIAGANADGAAEVKTAMPGKVVRLILSEGAAVEKGDAVMVVEAMKMQNDLKAPKAGVIKEIRVTEGQTVGAGDVLAIIE
jgi:Acetyl/propionyl-CoA carboxylase, alpha subunit